LPGQKDKSQKRQSDGLLESKADPHPGQEHGSGISVR
jgi:hypothetical protein